MEILKRLKPHSPRLVDFAKRTIHFISLCVQWQPFTIRGMLAIFLSIFAIKVFALQQFDLVAYVLGGGTLFLAALTALTGLIFRFRIGRHLKAQVAFDEQKCLSQRDTPAGIVLEESSVPPYFSLRLRRKFEQEGVESLPHLLTGRADRRHVIDAVRFPHRGLWSMRSLELTLSDWLGFTRLSWELPTPANVEVSAPTIPIKPLPIVAASSRAGDQLSQSRERSGDLFDIRPYDPSDGTKKILWKTFAHSGELVVRRPEQAVIPEGEVAVYLMAGRYDDHVAGAFQSYLEQLQRNQITVLFGTDGIGEQVSEFGSQSFPSDVKGLPFVSHPDEICHAINCSVWSSNAGSGRGFEAYLESLENANRRVGRVIVFAPSRSDGWFRRIVMSASLHSVALTVALVEDTLDPMRSLGLRLEKNEQRLPRSVFEKIEHSISAPVRGTLRTLSRPFMSGKGNIQEIKELTVAITQAGAELLVCEGAEPF